MSKIFKFKTVEEMEVFYQNRPRLSWFETMKRKSKIQVNMDILLRCENWEMTNYWKNRTDGLDDLK